MTRGARTLDAVEKLIAAGLYVWLVWRIVAGFVAHGGAASLFILPSEGLVLVFLLLRRRANELSIDPWHWLLAFGATVSPMLVVTGVDRPLVPPAIAAALMTMGTLVQLHAKLTLGRSFGCVPAHRGLQLVGPYRLVRHPIYAGYFIAHLAFLIVNPTAWNLAAYAIGYAFQIPRMIVEERFLARDPEYAAYLARVRWRLIPGIF
jgi:protein-S-isoprenylcysteine O-methyltransferase Ste14